MPEEFIECKPTAEGYARTLILIITSSTSAKDRAWAVSQVIGYVKFYAQSHPEYFHQEKKEE